MLSFPGRRLVKPAGLVVASMLLGALLLPPQALGRAGQEDFGRWELRSDHCKRSLAESLVPSPCQVVQLVQRQQGLLNVNFIARGAEKGSMNQLTFVGELKPGSPAMRCSQARCMPQGACTPSSVASVRPALMAAALRRGFPALGRCMAPVWWRNARSVVRPRRSVERPGRRWQRPPEDPIEPRFAAEKPRLFSRACVGISEVHQQEYLALGQIARHAQGLWPQSGRKDKGVCHAGEVPMGKGGLL